MRSPKPMLLRLGLRYACFSWAVLGAGCAAIVRSRGLALEHEFRRRGLEHELLEVCEAQVEYWLGGEGTPVVLLHGFGPPAPWQWSEQVGAFGRKHRLLVPNLLWFGASRDCEPHRIGVERQIEVLACLLESLRIRDAAIVGTSYGGIVGYGLAASRPDLVNRLVLVDSPGMNFETEMYEGILERHDVDDVAELFVPHDARGVQRLLDLGYWSPPSVPAPMRRAVADVLYDDRREQKIALLHDLASRLKSHRFCPPPPQPTLVLWGQEDTVFPPSIGRDVAQRIGADFRLMPRTRHAPNIEHPQRFNRWVLDWLEATQGNRPQPAAR